MTRFVYMCVSSACELYVYFSGHRRKRPLVSEVRTDLIRETEVVLVIVEDLAGSSGKNLLTARVDPTKVSRAAKENSQRREARPSRRHLTRPNRVLLAEFGLN